MVHYKEINKSNKLIPIIFFAVILWIAFLIRQSTLIISILLLCTIAWQTRKFSSLLVILIFLFFSIASKNSSQPWHTAFVGIGAYPNSLEIKLSDQSGYNYYFEKTGVKIKLDEPYDNLYDKNVRNEYYSTLKNAFMDYVRKYPLEIFRNASLNILQSFSIGYLVKYPELNYLSALFGLVILILLFKKHMYFLSILIITNVAGFIFYFPPIPAYMFSNYFLLTLALLAIVKQRMY